MKKYTKQLLTDLKAITAAREELRDDKQDAFWDIDEEVRDNAVFEEVEKYLSDDPKETLGQHCGLKREQFPSAEMLTLIECRMLVKALKRLYSAFNFDANIPKKLPIRVRYTEMVKALDTKVSLDWFGITSLEHCHYDYEGICPFGVKRCDCFLDWEKEVLVTKAKSEKEWFDSEAVEVIWYDLLERFEEKMKELELVREPNQVAVQKILRQLAKARLVLQETSLSYNPDEDEMPDGDFISLFEALGVGAIRFPKVNNLTALQLDLLRMALLLLFGKRYCLEHFVAWDLSVQYERYVAHWSRWGKIDESVDYLCFLMQIQEQTIFDLARESSKYRSYEDYIMNYSKGTKESRNENGEDLPF